MMRIAAIMTEPVITIEAEAPLDQAYDLMRHGKIHHLPVVRAQRLVGLVTARHIHGVESCVMSSQTPPAHLLAFDQLCVSDIMTTEVTTLHPDTPAHEVARRAWEQDTGCFLITDGAELLGIVTTTDLLDLFVDGLAANTPSRYDHLLMSTDFGAAATPTLHTALSLARQHQARLTLLHVLPRVSKFFATDLDHVSAETVAMLAEACQADALAHLETLIPSDMDRVSYRVEYGDTATIIVNTALAAGADLIIMGRRQRRRPYGLRRGITKRVIKRAPCPILLVQAEAHYELVRR
jgi:CBS domain-containing protein/nucleotide-binding universal stress UspA family protein